MSDKKEIVTSRGELKNSGRQLRRVAPLVDIYESEEEILLHVDLPGVSKEDIHINLEGGRLTLDGTRLFNQEGVMKWEELSDLQYHREFSVPQTIDAEKVSARVQDGVLHLHLPKTEAAKPRQIEIKTS